MDGGKRGISPVVGVVLLVAVVVALSAVSMTFFFTSSSDQDDKPAPNTQFNIEQQTSLELYNSPDMVEYELKMIGGESLNGSKVEIQGIENPDILDGQQFGAGQSLTVTPVGKQIRIVYKSEDRVDAVLHRFDVASGASVTVRDCQWLAEQNSEPSPGPMPWTFNVEVPAGSVVNCDIMTKGYITVKKNAEIIGYAKNVKESDNVTLAPGSVVHGDVSATEAIKGENATVLSNVIGTDGKSPDPEPNIFFNGTSLVEGDIRVDSKPGNPGSRIFLNDTTTVKGDISASKGATGHLELQNGNVSIGGNIDFSDAGASTFGTGDTGSTVDRNYEISGDIILAPGSKGSLYADLDHVTINGDLVVYNTPVNQEIHMSDTTVKGNLYTDLSSSRIKGQNVKIKGNKKVVSQYGGFEDLYANVTSAKVTPENKDEIRVTFDRKITETPNGQLNSAFNFENLGTSASGWRANGNTVIIELKDAVAKNNANIRVKAAPSINAPDVFSAGGKPFADFDVPVQNNAGD
jgi:flagellin-like protein